MATVAQAPSIISIIAPATTRARRTIETVVVVAIWVALGISLHLSVRAYLLVGIPLTAAFQWVVRREPMRALWLPDPAGLRFDARAWIIAAYFVLAPLGSMARDVAVHCCIGVPLSIYWRRSGNLFVTGSTHALIDAVRNALLVLPWH